MVRPDIDRSIPIKGLCMPHTFISLCQQFGLSSLAGANLREANLHRAYLCEADLHEADLRNANLHRAYLHSVNLHRANLHRADIREADLRNADLRDADLCRADLCKADLHRADLRGADLREANLSSADLRGADLRGTDLRGTDLVVLSAGRYTAYIQSTTTAVGCERHPSVSWLSWSPGDVCHMDLNARQWWEDWGPAVKAMIEVLRGKFPEETST